MASSSKRIVFLIDEVSANASFDPLALVHALGERGVDAWLYCHKYAGSYEQSNVRTVELGPLSSPDYWRQAGVSVVVALVYRVKLEVMQAIKQSGALLFLWLDTDGHIDFRHPLERLVRVVTSKRLSLLAKLKKTKVAIDEYRGRFDDNMPIDKLQLADGLIIETIGAANRFKQYLIKHKLHHLIGNLLVIGHMAKPAFTIPSIATTRVDRIVGACRWSDETKNGEGWFRAASSVAAKSMGIDFLACGASGVVEDYNASSAVSTTGWMDLPSLSECFGNSKILFISSFRESQPIVALEALCMGCTVVMPPMPCADDILQGDRFGTKSEGWSVRQLASALCLEVQKWRDGARDPEVIASHWRSRTNARAIAAVYQQSLDLQ